MLAFEPSSWSVWEWFLHLFGLSVTILVVVFTIWFARLEGAIARDEPDAIWRFNRAIKGFPNAVFAKMLGKRRLREE